MKGFVSFKHLIEDKRREFFSLPRGSSFGIEDVFQNIAQGIHTIRTRPQQLEEAMQELHKQQIDFSPIKRPKKFTKVRKNEEGISTPGEAPLTIKDVEETERIVISRVLANDIRAYQNIQATT